MEALGGMSVIDESTSDGIRTPGVAIVVVGAVLAAGLATPVGTATAGDSPIVAEDRVEHPAGYGIRVDRYTVGDLQVNLNGSGPATSTEVSVGFVIFEDRELKFALALSVHASPDRTITTPFPDEAEDERRQVFERGELPDSVEADIGLPTGDDECPLICLTINSFDREPGSHYYVVWVGGTSDAHLTARSEDGGNVVTNRGDAMSLGDPALDNGVRYQVQRTLKTPIGPQPVGAKAMKDATADFDVENELYGAWGKSDFKKVCRFGLGPSGCVQVSNNRVCRARDLNCFPSKISYDGPDGGGEGESIYGLFGEPPGEYTFRVDHKVDPYGPEHSTATPNTWVNLGENYSWLTVTDVDLPGPPAS